MQVFPDQKRVMTDVMPCLPCFVDTLLEIVMLELLHGEQVILLGQLLRIFSLFDQQDLGMIDEKGTQIDNYKEQRTRFCVFDSIEKTRQRLLTGKLFAGNGSMQFL